MSAYIRRVGIFLVLIFVMIFTSGTLPLSAAFGDTQGHWASTAIESLAAKGIIAGDPDNTFDPERPITRGEFANLVANAFALSEGEQPVVSSAPVDEAITRAEAAQIVAEVLDVADVAWFTEGAAPHFTDLSSDHPAYSAVQALESLGVLPAFLGTHFEPTVPMTRAEAAWIIYQSSRLDMENGTTTFVDAPTSRITLQTQQGRIRDVRTEADTVIVRHDALDSLDSLTAGDQVFIVSDRFGTPKLVVANGRTPAESEDLTERIAALVLEVFTVEELQQMIAGDWSVAANGLQREVQERLAAAGVTEAETHALMAGDWQSVQGSVMDRLQAELTERLSISNELADALLQGDWATVRDQAQLEVAQHLLNRLLATMDKPAQA